MSRLEILKVIKQAKQQSRELIFDFKNNDGKTSGRGAFNPRRAVQGYIDLRKRYDSVYNVVLANKV